MPRKAHTPEHKRKVRERILDTAVALLIEKGYANLSMRKIAARLGTTTSLIYTHFANKDELNINVRTRGARILYGKLLAAYNRSDLTVNERSRAMTWAFVEFALENPAYYDLMYVLHTPKYTNYIGTKQQKAAADEKRVAMQPHELAIKMLAEMTGLTTKSASDYKELKYRVIQNWANLHGIISLYKSHILYETATNDKEILKRCIDDEVERLLAYAGERAMEKLVPSAGDKQKLSLGV